MAKNKKTENTENQAKETVSTDTAAEQIKTAAEETAEQKETVDPAAESTKQDTVADAEEKSETEEAVADKAENKDEEKSESKAGNEEDLPVNDKFTAKVIVVTSGKGGVGKTTTAASISTGLALAGHKTAVIDFDVGLRNLDLLLNCERRVVYDFIHVVHGEAKLRQALIKYTRAENLFVLAASQTKDKDALTLNGVGRVLKELSEMGFEYIVCDSPAGIEKGAMMALYYADEAIVTTNPEISSVRDSDRILGLLDAKSRRSILGWEPVKSRLLMTRYAPKRVDEGDMMSVEAVQEFLSIPLVGVIPESETVICASNDGDPVILYKDSEAGQAYEDTVKRILGEEVPMRFLKQAPKKGFFGKLFGK